MKSSTNDTGVALDGVRLDPRTQKFVDALKKAGGPPIYTLSPAVARKAFNEPQSLPVDKLPADITERTIPRGPSVDEVSIRIVRPRGASGPLPAIIYLHGGGWMLGDADTHDRLVREIANGTNAAVVFVNYSRTPEARFPVAIEQAYSVAKHVAENGRDFDVDPSRMAIAGDSAGGNMTAAVTLLAKERGGPHFCYQAMFYPATDARFDTPSYGMFAEGPWNTAGAMKSFWDAYAPDPLVREKSTVSPLRATTLEQLRDLPSALIITVENDVLRDEGEAYAHKLMQAGVEVTALRSLGTIHDFMMLNGLADTPAVRGAIAIAIEKLSSALAK